MKHRRPSPWCHNVVDVDANGLFILHSARNGLRVDTNPCLGSTTRP